MSSAVVPTFDPAAEALRVQREGAYINAVLRAQDEARRSQQIAARNREYALALQQRMQTIALMQAQSRQAFATQALQLQRNNPGSSSPSRLEQLVTEETVIVPQ
jgi:hypothetical protein